MSGHLSPIQLDSYRPLRELVCETIRQAIVDGVFSPGERLMKWASAVRRCVKQSASWNWKVLW